MTAAQIKSLDMDQARAVSDEVKNKLGSSQKKALGEAKAGGDGSDAGSDGGKPGDKDPSGKWKPKLWSTAGPGFAKRDQNVSKPELSADHPNIVLSEYWTSLKFIKPGPELLLFSIIIILLLLSQLCNKIVSFDDSSTCRV